MNTGLHTANGNRGLLDVRKPPAIGSALGVADVMAITDSLATDLTQRQAVTPFVAVVAALAQRRQAFPQEPAWNLDCRADGSYNTTRAYHWQTGSSHANQDAGAEYGEAGKDRG